MAQSLDHFLPNVVTADTHKRLQAHSELVPYLQDKRSSLYCEDMDRLIDGLHAWINCSSYKISLNGLEVVSILLDRMGEHFRPHVTTVLPACLDRLGDSKDSVREASEEVLLKLMLASSAQFVLERCTGAFTHKLWRVKEEILIILQKTITANGVRQLKLSQFVPAICKLVEDGNGSVREAAIGTLVEIYRHVGERVRSDISKKDINPSKLNTIYSRMDEVKNSGQMLVNDNRDDVDFAKPVGVPKASSKRLGSANQNTGTMGRKSSFTAGKNSGSQQPLKAPPTNLSVKRKRPASANSSSSAGPKLVPRPSRSRSCTRAPAYSKAASGGMDEDTFIRGFEDVPKINIFSARELNDHMTKLKDTMMDQNHDKWDDRVNALKSVRGLMIAGAADYDDFLPLLRTLEAPVVLCVKDLRSQVVREACMTVAYLSQQLGNKMDHFAEIVFTHLVNLIQNSAKIMASSGAVCIRFILQHTHAQRLIPLLTQNFSHKSSIIRRESGEYLCQVLQTWPTHTLERHIAVLQEGIKKGIGDADAEARAHARKAFWGFHDHFREQGESLLNSLDASKQKQLQGELSNSSSSSSLGGERAAGGGPGRVPVKSAPASKSRARSMSTERSHMLYGSSSSGGPKRSLLPGKTTSSHQNSDSTDSAPARTSSKTNHLAAPRSAGGKIVRSSSAVDLAGGGGSGHYNSSSLPRPHATPRSRHPSGPSHPHHNTSGAATTTNYNSLRLRTSRLPCPGGSRDSLDSEDDLDSEEGFESRRGPMRPQYRALRKASAPAVCLTSALRMRGQLSRGDSLKVAAAATSGKSYNLNQSYDERSLRQALSPSSERPSLSRTNSSTNVCPNKAVSPTLSRYLPRQKMSLPNPAFIYQAPRPKKYSYSGTSGDGPGNTTTGGPSSLLSPERSRGRSKIGVSQSQPSSRSSSPSSRLSYITHNSQLSGNATLGAGGGTAGRQRQTRIPRSQGASRETSPNRTYGRERKYSGSNHSRLTKGAVSRHTQGHHGALAQRVLAHDSDTETALAAALHGSGRKRYDTYESDDAASETSSVCSERSFTYGRSTESPDFRGRRSSFRMKQDVQEIMGNMSSSSWADRKEGLLQLQNMLRGGRTLTRIELKKVTDIFARMIHDPHGKVFSYFLETLQELLAAHKSDLHDWLHTCLTRLLNKMGADMLGSIQAKVGRALEVVRDSFPYDHQFNCLTKFIVDVTQTPNLKVKIAVLNYLHGLATLMDPGDFTNSSDTRLAMSKVITWTTEPKSVDVRKAAQAVLIALFNLNTPEFSMLLSALPSTFQTGATKILHNHVRTHSTDHEPLSMLSPRNVASPATHNRYRPPSRTQVEEVDTENMNPEEIYNSIKQTSADIQNLGKWDTGGHYDVKTERDTTSQDSGIQGSLSDVRGHSPDVRDGLTKHQQQRANYNPHHYQDDSMNGYSKAALAEAVFDVDNELFNEEFPIDQSDAITEILAELSNHNERKSERTDAMISLLKLTREGSGGIWEEHFKTILLLLLETLGDNDSDIRSLALRVLREILRHQPERFKDYAELTILKVIEAHRDPVRLVSRAAEQCAVTLAHSIPTEQCTKVLTPLIQTAEFPVNLYALKVQTKVVENSTKEALNQILEDLVSCMLKGYENPQSSVRKASVFCLVAIYQVIGEDLRPHIQGLRGSQMKLLNLYIKRAAAGGGNTGESASTSQTTSPVGSTYTELS